MRLLRGPAGIARLNGYAKSSNENIQSEGLVKRPGERRAMREEDSTAVVERLIAAFNRRDAAQVAALLHDEVVCTGIPLPPAQGKAAAMDLLAPFLAAEAVDWQVHAIAAKGAVVHTERTDRFRFAGAGWTAVRAAGVFEIAPDGRVIAWRDYFDLAELMAALPETGPVAAI